MYPMLSLLNAHGANSLSGFSKAFMMQCFLQDPVSKGVQGTQACLQPGITGEDCRGKSGELYEGGQGT